MLFLRVNRIQNMCAKLVLNRSRYDSSKQALYDLHLPIKARINFKILIYESMSKLVKF